MFGAVALSVAVDVMAPFTPNLVPNDLLLAVLYGGAVGGLGLGLVFKAGGNTGGSDIVAQLLTSRISLGVGQIMLLVDAAVMLAAGAKFGPTLALYGIVAVFVMAAVVDYVQEGVTVDKTAFVMTDKAEELTAAILDELGRGVTLMAGQGYPAEASRGVVYTVVSRRELDRLKELVRGVDPEAFLVVSDAREVRGKGFKGLGAALPLRPVPTALLGDEALPMRVVRPGYSEASTSRRLPSRFLSRQGSMT